MNSYTQGDDGAALGLDEGKAPPRMLEMFQCKPYRMKLSTTACAEQYVTARETSRGEMGAHHLCRGCPDGKAHAAGHSTSAGLVSVESKATPSSMGKTKRARRAFVFADKTCPCGTTFTPGGGRQVFCKTEACTAVGKSAHKAAPKSTRPERRACDQCGDRFVLRRSDQRFCPGGICAAKYRARRIADTRGGRPEQSGKTRGKADAPPPSLADVAELLKLAGYRVVKAVGVPNGLLILLEDPSA